MKRRIFEMIRYGLVGGVATLADASSYYVLSRIVGLHVLAANPLAYFIGNLISFAGHRLITFHSSGKPLSEYSRFLAVTAVGLGISQLVVWSLVRIGLNDLLAKAVSIAASGLFNYAANSLWTFRERKN
jgi:putative flippase GtrA